jgi:hypothetical protein
MKMAETAKMPPTLTSMPPMMMTSVMPALTMASSRDARRVETMLPTVRKYGELSAKPAPTARMAASSTISRPAVGEVKRNGAAAARVSAMAGNPVDQPGAAAIAAPESSLEVELVDVVLGEDHRGSEEQDLVRLDPFGRRLQPFHLDCLAKGLAFASSLPAQTIR